MKCKLRVLPSEDGQFVMDGLKLGIKTNYHPNAPKIDVYFTSKNKINYGDWYIDDTNQVRKSVMEWDEDYWSRRPDYERVEMTSDRKLFIFEKVNYEIVNKFPTFSNHWAHIIVEKYNSPENGHNLVGEILDEKLMKVYTDYQIEDEPEKTAYPDKPGYFTYEETENLIRNAMQSKGFTPEYEIQEFMKGIDIKNTKWYSLYDKWKESIGSLGLDNINS